jgi:hypothetical protein
MCTCSSQKDNEVVMNQNAIFINHVNLLNSAAKTGSSKKYCFFISWDFRVHLCINFWWGDMEIWGNAANGHAVSSSGAVVPCVAGTCAPAAGLMWPHLAPGTCHGYVCVCVRCGQDFNRRFSSYYACAAEICRFHQYSYLLHSLYSARPRRSGRFET